MKKRLGFRQELCECNGALRVDTRIRQEQALQGRVDGEGCPQGGNLPPVSTKISPFWSPLTPSMTGPPQGLELTSRVSSVELYLSASASAASPAGSILLSLTFRTLSVRFRFSTWAMYVMPF